MIDLRNYDTADLVEELLKRDEIIKTELVNPTGIYPWYVIRIDFTEYQRVTGPCRVLVVREEQP